MAPIKRCVVLLPAAAGLLQRRAVSTRLPTPRARFGDLDAAEPVSLGAAVDWDDVEGARFLAKRAAAAASQQSDDPLLLLIPVAIVGFLFLAATVVTVDVDDDTPPPPQATYPKLADWLGEATPRRRPEPVAAAFELAPVVTARELFAATLFQWRVFEFETGGFPTGFQRGDGDGAAVELLRALVSYWTTGLPNARRYEARATDEFAAGADASPRGAPAPRPFPDAAGRAAPREAVVRTCAEFADGYGLSVVARADDGECLGLISLRLRRLPPADALWPARDADPRARAPAAEPSAEPYRLVGYITGLAVASVSRRKGVASALVDYCERKAAAWGAAGMCLHVNRLNAPALRFYDTCGFTIVPDWIGFNNQRFLLYRPFDGAPELPPAPAADEPAAAGDEPPAVGEELPTLDLDARVSV